MGCPFCNRVDTVAVVCDGFSLAQEHIYYGQKELRETWQKRLAN